MGSVISVLIPNQKTNPNEKSKRQIDYVSPQHINHPTPIKGKSSKKLWTPADK
jgi:hypothetical protein